MELASSFGHEDQVEDQDLVGRAKDMCGHCGHGPSVIENRLTSIEDELAVIRKLLETKSRRHSKCVSSSVRSSRKRILKALQFAIAKKTKVNTLDGSHLSHLDHFDYAHDGPSSPLPDEVVDASFKTLPLTDLVYVHNDDGLSSHLPDQVDVTSCKTLL
ncbi:hypothetical protein K7X08_037691 [Anisodus acutangulus]|uniref:Uncharacterized protein n=1 Tax=Anisodus acutangulus TaxID=402998 RepID=A0A9Q1RSG3_9SOLA|nr:hypothetical protein K7X08_037691 [Anisodus acutangulus]